MKTFLLINNKKFLNDNGKSPLLFYQIHEECFFEHKARCVDQSSACDDEM